MAPTHQSLLPMDPHFPEIPHYGVDGSVPLASTAQSHHQTLVTIPLGAAGLGSVIPGFAQDFAEEVLYTTNTQVLT